MTVRAGDMGAPKHRGRFAEHERGESNLALAGQVTMSTDDFEERLRVERGEAARAALRDMAKFAEERSQSLAGASGDYTTDVAVTSAWYDVATDLHIAADKAGTTCACFEVPEKFHTVHYGATEPGSTMEFNPHCPVHGYDEPPNALVDPDLPPF